MCGGERETVVRRADAKACLSNNNDNYMETLNRRTRAMYRDTS